MAKILLVDDSNFVLAAFEKHLRQAGHQVVGKANDGEEFLAMYDILGPDLVLLDIAMPNNNGLEALNELLTNAPNAKVIVVSAESDKTTIDACLARGAKAFLPKSQLKLDNFADSVLKLIDQVLTTT